MDLVEFLTARLNEEAADIRGGIAAGESNISALDLLDVQAKQSIVDAYALVADMDTSDPEPEFAYGRAVGLGEAVRLLAVRYADHPDYDEAWRP